MPAFCSSAIQSPSRLPTLAPASRSFKHLAGEEVGLHELAERAADLVLAMGDDRGVRNRDAEGMTEQCGHGEPIGQRADHRCLGERPDVADPPVRLFEPAGDEEHDGDEHQQAGGDAFILRNATRRSRSAADITSTRGDATGVITFRAG